MIEERLTLRRVVSYVLGLLSVSLGIVLCKKCGLGISPISSVPFVLADVTPLTFGTLTTLFHFTNTAAQMLLSRKLLDPKLWLQAPLAFVFGRIIDAINALLVIDSTVLAWQLLALAFSIFFTALGMVLMLDGNLIQNPPDGTVKQLSVMLHTGLGSVKVGYDVSCVLLSVLIGLLCLHRVRGFGIATVASAIFVGKTIGWLRAAQSALKKKGLRRRA